MWWPLPSILSGKFRLSFSPFLKRINQENKKNKNKKGCECEKGYSGFRFPSQGQPAPPTLGTFTF
jgi:hypothetical protein